MRANGIKALPVLLFLIFGFLSDFGIRASDFPVTGWRGDGAGYYPQAKLPTHWGAKSNILWQTQVGTGQSMPIIVGEKIILTAEPDKLVCVNRGTGRVLWQSENGYASLPAGLKAPDKLPPTTAGCGYATPTPVSDGKFIYVSYATGIVVCHDLDGQRKWLRFLDEPQISRFGRAASPVLAGGKLVVSLGGLTALDPQTGQTLWQTFEAKPSFGTPFVTKLEDATVVVTSNGDCVRCADGKILATNLAHCEYVSPIVQNGIAYFAGAPSIAVKLPGQKLWENEDPEGEFFATPILHEGLLYFVNNAGNLSVLDAATGKTVWQKALEVASQSGDPNAPAGNLYPSVTLAGHVLLLGNDVGETLVLAPGRAYQELAHNRLDSGSGASSVLSGSRLFLRGGKKLYCIGAP
jgi:outer membrane protein assembly factor BamB